MKHNSVGLCHGRVDKRSPRNRVLNFILAGTVGSAFAYPAMAQDDGVVDNSRDTIIVTAQKRAQNVEDVPISISVLGGDELDAATDDTLNDVISQLPGVYSYNTGQNGGTKFTVRGVTSNTSLFAGGATVGYYLDELPFGLAKVPISPNANVYDLERVEVLRGPQGTLFGASSLNGVIRVLTKDADVNEFELKARGSVSHTDGGGENYRGDVALNIPLIANKAGFRAVFGYDNYSGWIDRTSTGEQDVNDAEIRTLRLKLNAKPTDELDVELLGWFSRDDRGGPSVSAGNSETISTKGEPIDTDYDVYGASITYQFPSFTVLSATSYMEYNSIGNIDILNGAETLVTGIASDVFSQELRFNSSHDGPLQWSLGGMYRDGDDTISQGFPLLIWGELDSVSIDSSESFAIFGELTYTFADGLFDLTGGLRYFEDKNGVQEVSRGGVGVPPDPVSSEQEFDAITPRAVLTWYPSEEMIVYASFSQGFRSGFGLSRGVIAIAPDAEPVNDDLLTNYEIGSKGALYGGRLNYDFSAYYVDWDDTQQQLFVFNGTGFVAVPINGATIRGVGIDAALSANLIDDLGFTLSGSWNDLGFAEDVFSSGIVVFEKGERPDESPEFTAGGSIDYSKSLGGGYEAQFSGAVSYSSKTTSHALGSGAITFGDEFINLGLDVSLASPHGWVATVFADNIVNQDPVIRPFSGSPLFNSRVRPRTFGLQLEFKY